MNKKMLGLVGGLVAIGAVIAYGSMSSSDKAAPKGDRPEGHVTVRLGHFPNITHAPALVGVAREDFEKALGEASDLDVKVVNAGPEAMEALLAGELDVTYVGPSPAINTYIKSEGKALRVISGVCSGGASLVATKESGIRGIKDLNGKKVATPQLGNTQDVSLRSFIAKEGLQPKDKGGQVEIIPTKNPDILMLFKQKQIDAAWVPEPWASRIVEETGAVRVIDERDLWPDKKFTTTVMVARTEFADRHPELVAKLVEANAQIIDWMNANTKDAQKLVNEQLAKLTGKPLKDSLLEESWKYMEFTSDPMEWCFDQFAISAKECGFLKNVPDDMKNMFDLTALKAVSKP
ncbi:MAG: ABC transporter substrate-binding protein [Fimbriimonas sp.]